MKPAVIIGIAAALGVVGAGVAVYAYESGQPISITLAPSTANGNTTTTSMARKVGQKITLNLPAGGTWVTVSNLYPAAGIQSAGLFAPAGSSSGSANLQVGGNSPVTYTVTATDLSLVAVWTLNGATYIYNLNFT